MISSLTHLRSFIAIAEHGSLSRAAQALHYSQPALSLQLRALERDLDCRLFDRTARGLRLTTAGRQALVLADEIVCLCARLSPESAPPTAPAAAPGEQESSGSRTTSAEVTPLR